MKNFKITIVIFFLLFFSFKVKAQWQVFGNNVGGSDYLGANALSSSPLELKTRNKTNQQPINFYTRDTLHMTLTTRGHLDLINIDNTSAYRIGGFNVLWNNGNPSNIYVGALSGNSSSVSSSNNNTFVGAGSGQFNNATISNTFVGFAAGYSGAFSPADSNTYLGAYAGYSNKVSKGNVFLGYSAGYYHTGNVTGDVYIGAYSGYQGGNPNYSSPPKIPGENVFVGFESGERNQASVNTFLGFMAGTANTDGGLNTFVGGGSGQANTKGNFNTFVGAASGSNNTEGNNNCYIGTSTVSLNANSIGNRNNFLGSQAGAAEIIGDDNQHIGYQAGFNSNSGEKNILIGSLSGNNLTGNGSAVSGTKTLSTIDIENVLIGHNSGINLKGNTTANTGSFNTFIGTYAGNSTNITTTTYATSMGYKSQAIADKSIAIGRVSNIDKNGTSSIAIGDNSNINSSSTTITNNAIAIGSNAQIKATTVNSNNSIAIGSNSSVTNASNSVVIGNGATTNQANAIIIGNASLSNVLKVGIGTSTPTNNLEIKASTSGISGLTFGNLDATSATTTTTTNNKVLAVNTSGEVVLVNDQTTSTGASNFFGAENGTSINSVSKNVEWGQPVATTNDPGRLLHNTEIPMGLPSEHNLLNNIYFTGQSNISSAPASISIGQAGSSVANLTLPQAKLDVLNYSTSNPVVNNNAGLFTTSGTYSGYTKSYLVGVKGVSEIVTHGNFNIGGDFEGKNSSVNYGVRGNALSSSSSQLNGVATNYGVAGYGYNSQGIGYGLFGAACKNKIENYGVYGIATVPNNIFGSSQYGVYGKVDCINKQKNYAVFGQVGTPNTLPTCSLTTAWAGYFNGRTFTPGAIFTSSDSILKENIETISGNSALNIISQLLPKKYNFRQNDFPSINLPSGNQFGLIAQQVERVIPNLVTDVVHPAYYDSLGNKIFDTIAFKALNYEGFIPILIASVKQLNTNVNGATNGLSISGNNQYELGGSPLNHVTEIPMNGNNIYFSDNNQANSNIGFGHLVSENLEAKVDVVNDCADNINLYAGKFLNVGSGCAGSGTLAGVYASSQVDDNATNIGGDFSAYHGRVNIGIRATISGTPRPNVEGNSNIADAPGGYAIYGDAGNSTNFWAGYFNGYVGTTCGWFQASDGKLKENVKQISATKGQGIIKQLRPSTYTFKANEQKAMNLPSGNQYGLIAEDVEKVMPELVREMSVPARLDKNGKEISAAQTFKGVNYVGMIPVLISALQQMDSTNQNLQEQINALKNCCGFNSKVPTNLGNSTSTELSDLGIILDQNSPNPFAEQTIITYTIPESVQDAKLIFYTNNGTILKTIQINERGAGSVTVYASNLSSGIYTYSLIADGKVDDSKKMVCTKR